MSCCFVLFWGGSFWGVPALAPADQPLIFDVCSPAIAPADQPLALLMCIRSLAPADQPLTCIHTVGTFTHVSFCCSDSVAVALADQLLFAMSARQVAVTAFFAGRPREASAFVAAPRNRRSFAPTSQPDPLPMLAITNAEATADDIVGADAETELEAELDAVMASDGAVAASSPDGPIDSADGDVDVGACAASAVDITRRATTVGLLMSLEIPLRPTCGKCKELIMDPLKAVVAGKGAGCWKCPECNTKCTQLNRIFGPWPLGLSLPFQRICRRNSSETCGANLVVNVSNPSSWRL